ncbi:MAG TPA: polyphenol oxidase family protein, partial [Acidimicrobiales bacterium]|nr:polyphenol oxidase family protein [Acidimicrobiales bacterium]
GLIPPPPVPAGLRPARLHQVHGAGVVVLDTDPEPEEKADALVSRSAGWVVAVLTADCAPVALASPSGTFGAVHAGWRGLMAGIVEAAVAAVAVPAVVGGLGPTIGPCCYEFSQADLDRVAGRFGDEVRATTRAGAPALDLPQAVRVALREAGVELVVDHSSCTACGGGSFSYRARGDDARQALYVWRDDGGR